MRVSLIISALAAVLLLASGIGWLVVRTVTARIERTLAAETRSVLIANLAGETLDGLEVRFDGLEGEVAGVVADPDRRRRLDAAIDFVHSGKATPLKGRVMTLENRLTAP